MPPWDAGITCFDTAEAYGDGVSEQVLGRALKGHRHNVVVASKAVPDHFGRESLKQACERSLRNLGTDYIDIYQLHWPNREIPFDETADTLRELMREGKIRAAGVSNFGPGDLGEIHSLIPVVTDQVAYSLLFRAVEHEVVPACIEHNVGILVYSPLAQSLLTGKYMTADDVPEERAATRLYSNERPATRHSEDGCEKEIFAALGEIRTIADEVGVEMAPLSLAWLLRRPAVSSVIVGARDTGQLRRNMAAVSFDMPPELVERLCTVTDTVKECLGANPDMWQTDSRIR